MEGIINYNWLNIDLTVDESKEDEIMSGSKDSVNFSGSEIEGELTHGKGPVDKMLEKEDHWKHSFTPAQLDD